MIIDHDHQSTRTNSKPRFVRVACEVCGQPSHRHLSWGRAIAAEIGGDPADYVLEIPAEEPPMP